MQTKPKINQWEQLNRDWHFVVYTAVVYCGSINFFPTYISTFDGMISACYIPCLPPHDAIHMMMKIHRKMISIYIYHDYATCVRSSQQYGAM